jgi:hypothetical protein
MASGLPDEQSDRDQSHGAPTSVKLESSEGITTIRRRHGKNVHGIQTYVVSYHLAGVINRHDELY